VLQSCQDDDVRMGYTHHFWWKDQLISKL
jgi:hypothetical protein